MALDIRQTKGDLANLLRRRLGEPVVKVELKDQQIYDIIDYSKQKWVKWGVGNSIVETYFTLMLIGSTNFYDLPLGVIDVVDVDDSGSQSGVNTLFTIENFMYSRGVLNPMMWNTGAYGYSIINYHLALDWLKTLDKYTPSIYNYKYHKYQNQIEVQPAPPSGNALEISGTTYDSPGFVMVRSYMIEGSHYGGMESDPSLSSWKRGDSDEHFYVSDWIFDYALAECKLLLGNIRSKFANFTSIGNVGIGLDGDSLISQGQAEKERLEETLRLEESHEGYGILMG